MYDAEWWYIIKTETLKAVKKKRVRNMNREHWKLQSFPSNLPAWKSWLAKLRNDHCFNEDVSIQNKRSPVLTPCMYPAILV